MIDNITITNLYTEENLEMNKNAKSKFLLETDGISWGKVDATHNTYTNLTGVGDVVVSTKLNTRQVSITGRVCSPHTNREIAEIYQVSKYSDILAKKLEEVEQAKTELSKIINPLYYLRIGHNGFFIDGKPSSSVAFSDKWKENNEIYCKFTFSLRCNDPMFHYKESTHTNLSGTFGGFHFPAVIPLPRGMHFGKRISYQLIYVSNPGDVAIGGVITIKANGTVNSPTFTNVETGEEITVRKTLSEGEVIKIDTVNRKIVGAIDGIHFENYFNYWDFDNSWFQFDIGYSLFGYSTEDNTYKNMDIWVEINQSLYSLEDE